MSGANHPEPAYVEPKAGQIAIRLQEENVALRAERDRLRGALERIRHAIGFAMMVDGELVNCPGLTSYECAEVARRALTTETEPQPTKGEVEARRVHDSTGERR